jgi:two-component system, sensor histidine kinase and response regulator
MRMPANGPLHILVAEDNPINQCVAARLLEKLGHTWVMAANGREALLAVSSQPFDLILMDIQMPEMDGLEATRRIREQEQGNGGHRPIIAVTANSLPGDREHFLNGGMDGYVSKPVRIHDLVGAIDLVMARR